MSELNITGLWTYPVKSMAGSPTAALRCDESGPLEDRRWMVVDQQGTFLSQRTLPVLGEFQASMIGRRLTMTAPDGSTCTVTPDQCRRTTKVRVWSDTVQVGVAPPLINTWLSEQLRRTVYLVRYQSRTPRCIDPEFAEGNVGFADGFPLLICHEASLAALNADAPVPLDMARFRPNVVVSGGAPWAENHWTELANAQHCIRLVKPCSRCVIITIDPTTQVKTPAVLKHLMRFSTDEGRPTFGQNGVLPAGSEPLLLGASLTATG